MPMIEPLQRIEVIKAIEKKNPERIPLVRSKWWGEGLGEQYGVQLAQFDKYPEDVACILIENPVNPEWMDLSWSWQSNGAHDSRIVIDDWTKLDEFIEKIPDPKNHPDWEKITISAKQAQSKGLYILFGWWRFFFEKPWELRGMENLFMDHYMNQDQVHKLHNAMCATYIKTLEIAQSAFNPDGFWTSDDLGHQSGAMIDPVIFETMLLPYYKQIKTTLNKTHMHFWLHSCGNNTELMEHLIEGGVNVFHPVQKHTMDEKETVKKFGDRITFLAGIDVQHTLIEKNPEEIRKEVRFLIDTFDSQTGGMCIGAGNGIVSGTPIENIDAFLDEAVKYGKTHRNQFKRVKADPK